MISSSRACPATWTSPASRTASRRRSGSAISDLFTGLYGVIAIEAALIERERTGRGQHIDLALLDTMGAMLANQAMNYLASGVSPRRMGTAHPNIAPYQTFPVADGFVIIAVGNDGQFVRLCTTLGLDGLATDARFFTNAARVANRDDLARALSAKTRVRTRGDLLAALEKAVVPAGPINTVADLFADPQFAARGMRIDAEGIPGVRSPIVMSGIAAFARPALTEAWRARGGDPARDRARLGRP